MSDRKAIGFWSDQHVGHLNSIKYDNRPFRDLQHMHETMINNYNSVIPENGLCYFLGDVGMTNSEDLKKFMSRLNGTKVCVMGNHDKGSNALYSIGFDVVVNAITLYIAGQRVTMSHCPLRGVFREDTTNMNNSVEGENWHGESRHIEFSVEDEGQYHLAGHIHSGPNNNKPKFTNRQYDVGVCANNYRPVSLGTIESWIAKEEMKKRKLLVSK